ncbi:hypothetical protein [Streptomyces sp. BE133]|uniref:hypothetical protein n=1 Tax=Streptomyces sp. BE133 TaxID=3002523 RepID=UPI002E76B5DC|nr:hypothetical protein [Streptomyces sp. BE133]MEE1805924.1 hypothetical protein [Streptomyces sp. BE133]
MSALIALDPSRTLLFRPVPWHSDRTYVKVIDPVRATAHHAEALWAGLRFEWAAVRWKKLDPQLEALVGMTSAATVGCGWCMDFGCWENHRFTTVVAMENMRSRTHSALGPTSQGFKDRCVVERPAGR